MGISALEGLFVVKLTHDLFCQRLGSGGPSMFVTLVDTYRHYVFVIIPFYLKWFETDLIFRLFC